MKSSNRNTILGQLNILYTDSFLSRLRGLLFTRNLDEHTCLIITPCRSIHTVGMLYSIHVLFLSKDNTVLKIVQNLKPNRICLGPSDTTKVVELSTKLGCIPLTVIGQSFFEGK